MFKTSNLEAINLINSITSNLNFSAPVNFAANVGAITSNGSTGTAGQVLTSNGSATYWSTVSGSGTVTSVATGNGVTGGPITTTGTISVVANDGITSNTSGLFVTQGTGTVVNATGVHVNSTYIGTIASNSATYANSSVTNTFTVGTASYFVANGNFGIGTSSPGTKLEVAGSITIKESGKAYNLLVSSPSTAYSGYLATYNSSGTRIGYLGYWDGSSLTGAWTDGSTPLMFGTNGSERIRVDSSGNVGIGTNSPSSTLDVSGTIRTGSGGTDPGTGAAFYFVGSGSYQTVVAGAEFAVHTGGNNARTERLRIDSSGNVGISNNAPSHKLSVNGTVYAGGKITSGVGAASDGLDLSTNDAWANMRVIRNNGGLYNDGMYIGYGNANSALTRIYGGGATSGSLDKYSTYSQEAGSFRAPIFYDSDNTSYYIDAASTSVLSNLNILSNCRVNDLQWYGGSGGSDQKYWDAYPSNDTGNSLNFRAVNDAYTAAYGWLTVTRSGYQPQDIVFYTGAGSERLRIGNNGNVGINTASPSQKLDVNGYISSDGTVCRNGVTNSPAPSVFNAFNISFDGTYAHMWIDNTDLGTIGTSSDYRIKKNVQTQTLSALDRIANIRPVTYQFAKNDHFTMIKDDDTIREGFIAHELAEIIPSAVTGEKDEPNKIQSLKLDALCSVLVKAIQELKAEFDDYKATHP